MKRITEYDAITTVAENDVVPIVDVSDTTQASSGSTKKGTIAKLADYLKDRTETLTGKTLSTGSTIDANVTVTEVLRKVYPVGSIYISTTSTNPNTLFGFGTWSAFGAGKVMVGIDSGDTDFDTVEETGGAKTVTLTSAQSGLPAHTHNVTPFNAGAGGGYIQNKTGNNSTSPLTQDTGVLLGLAASNTPANASEAHSNLQPYITVYFYKRTA